MRKVQVTYIINGTTKKEIFTASDATGTMAGVHSDRGTYLGLTDGLDSKGRRVLWKLYRNAEEITCWEVDDESGSDGQEHAQA